MSENDSQNTNQNSKKDKKKINLQIDQKDQVGVYSNAVSVRVNDNEVLLDFSYILPQMEPTTLKIVSRVNLSHASAEKFVSMLQNAMLDYRNKKGN